MKRLTMALACVLLVTGIGGLGCARAARDTSGFALREEAVLDAPFEDAWHAVKRVTLEQGYELYTRDKRGAFVAYTPMSRVLWTQPRRTKFSIELAQASPTQTAIAIESIRQVYGVTLLTHPNWHDRQQTDIGPSQALLDGIRAKLAEGLETEGFIADMEATPEAVEETSAEPTMQMLPLPAVEDAVVEEADTIE